MTYYHLFDLQNLRIMESGKNSKNLKELKEGLLSYISVDYVTSPPSNPEDNEGWFVWQSIKKMPIKKIAELWNFEIKKTTNKI